MTQEGACSSRSLLLKLILCLKNFHRHVVSLLSLICGWAFFVKLTVNRLSVKGVIRVSRYSFKFFGGINFRLDVA